MKELEVGDIVYGDPNCETLAKNYHNVQMKVTMIGPSLSAIETSRVLSVESKAHKVPATFTIMEHAVYAKWDQKIHHAGRVSKAEKDYYERVGYWETYFDGLEPLHVP